LSEDKNLNLPAPDPAQLTGSGHGIKHKGHDEKADPVPNLTYDTKVVQSTPLEERSWNVL